VSSPIFVKGRHFGAFRVAVSVDSIAAHKRALIIQLLITLAILATVATGFIYFTLRRSMRPLEQLAELATEISTGEKLDEPIRATTSDEIGEMARSLNRLRASLQAAMQRLGV
jgi:HAMP domain-containing protein